MSRETSGGGGSNAGAPTLTTPTLTPTTLRNIEQMFADRDPHEPPPHHLNAAGFVPPIIRFTITKTTTCLHSLVHFSPSSGSSYLNLSSLISSSPSLTTPTGEEPEVLPEPEVTSPGLSELLPDLPAARNGTNKPARPVSLSVGNSQPVLLPTSPLPRESPALPPLVRKLSSLPPPLVHIDC